MLPIGLLCQEGEEEGSSTWLNKTFSNDVIENDAHT